MTTTRNAAPAVQPLSGPHTDQLLLTVVEAARALRLSRSTIYTLIADGELTTVHIGRSCRITRGELERYVARLDTQA